MLKSLSKLVLIALALGLGAANCKKEIKTSTPPLANLPVGKSFLGTHATDFGVELFKEVAKAKPNENVLISPYSVQTAFLMAANGAKDQTLDEILQVLKIQGKQMSKINAEAKLIQHSMLNAGNPVVKIANAFFYDDKRLDVQSNYLAEILSYYQAQSHIKNFDSPNTLSEINDWVKNNTLNKIDKILEEIKSEDVAFIINALYFKADWLKPFAQEMTSPGEFQINANTKKSVSFMMAQDNFFTSTQNGLMLVELPFADSAISMSVLMPQNATNNSNWLQQINATTLFNLWEKVSYNQILLSLPKFELEFGDGLIPYLQAMGMEKPFSSQADFSPMGQSLIGPNLFIGAVEHKAVLKIDEKGAEGAAVTSIGMVTTSMPPMYRFDRPFVVVLRHLGSETPLFIGYVAEP